MINKEGDTMDIGYLIHSRRLELNLTLEEIGNYVGVSKSTVKKWEDGYISNMKRDKISSLSKILKISPVSLITGELEEIKNINDIELNNHEKEVITAYRSKPEMQQAVDRLLGVEENKVVGQVFRAACNGKNPEYISLTDEQRKKLEEAPSTDEL